LDAAKRLNQLCEEFGIPHKNYGIGTTTNQQPKQKISQYTGVCWHKRQDKWSVDLCLQGVKKKFGGYFNDELDAAKRINQLCEEFGIPHKNHGIGTIINQEAKQTSSQYTGVSRNTANGKWRARLYLQGRRTKNGGNFSDELDAAKRINQMCEEFGIPHKNHGINAIPNEQWQPKQKTSQYVGVYWYKERHKWRVQLSLQEEKAKFGGCFDDEMDAAKRVNQLCEQMGIPHKNHGIEPTTNQQHGDDLIDDSEHANPVISSEIANAENYDDHATKNKRKHEKDLIINDNSPVEKYYYFYDNYLN